MVLTKRGNVYHCGIISSGRRVRFSLGTRVREAARTLSRRIENARVEGPKSELWPTLRTVLPASSFKILTADNFVLPPSLAQFEKTYQDSLKTRVSLGELAQSSHDLYVRTSGVFFGRMIELGIKEMSEITPSIVDDYLVWRKNAIEAKGGSGRGIITENSVLSAVFSLALEEGVIKTSPVKRRYHPATIAEGAEPFTPEEMQKLEAAATGEFELPFLLLKFTGLRGGDAAGLTWDAIDLAAKTLRLQTKKRKNWVLIPLAAQLLYRLHLEYVWASPLRDDRVLPGMTRAKLYRLMAQLGKLAGVENCHPHRFRDTLCVTMLANGATIYDCAKMLGDQVATVEAHYSPFVGQLQERVRKILDQSS